MGTAIKRPVSDGVKPSFVMFDTLRLSPDRQSARMSKITHNVLTQSDTGCSCTYMATVGVKGLILNTRI